MQSDISLLHCQMRAHQNPSWVETMKKEQLNQTLSIPVTAFFWSQIISGANLKIHRGDIESLWSAAATG